MGNPFQGIEKVKETPPVVGGKPAKPAAPIKPPAASTETPVPPTPPGHSLPWYKPAIRP